MSWVDIVLKVGVRSRGIFNDKYVVPQMPELNNAKIQAAKPREKAYKLFDEKGLYLLVKPNGSRLWRFKYRVLKREKLLALGVYPDVSLKMARDRRDEARRQVADRVDPSVFRKAERIAEANSFEAVALEYLERQRQKLTPSSWAKGRWLLVELLCPAIGSLPIAGVDAPALLAALRRIEARGRHETAHRAKQAAGQVFRYAIATGRASRDPSADLRDALAPVVTKHRAAITEPARIGELLRAVDGYVGQPGTVTALKLAPLLFVRPGELRYANWQEFDLDSAKPEWRIPRERMKMREAHVVPLPTQAVALLKELKNLTGPDGLLFPSLISAARPISENTLNAALRRLGYGKEEMSAHGFRAMASTCLNEQGFAPDVIELQLAHKERNKVRAAYNRASRMAERRAMMQTWADYLDGLRSTANAIPKLIAR
jgi:integrase